MPAKRKLAQAQPAKRANGRPNSECMASCHSIHASHTTGSTKPRSTGTAHSSHTSQRAAPRKRTGRASVLVVAAASPLRLLAKRSLRCAWRSIKSKRPTTSNSTDASWAAATRSFIANHALKMPVLKVARPKYEPTP